MTSAPSNFCPMCGGAMKRPLELNALSRNNRDWICSDCGTREAIADFYPVEGMPRHCYCQHSVHGTVMVLRGVGGFYTLGQKLREVSAQELNDRWGVSAETADAMVTASMDEWGCAYDDTEEGSD